MGLDWIASIDLLELSLNADSDLIIVLGVVLISVVAYIASYLRVLA